MDQERDWLTLDEAAFMLKVGVPTVQSLIERGLLTASDADGEPRLQRQDIVVLLRRNQQELDHDEPDELAQDYGLMGKRTDE